MTDKDVLDRVGWVFGGGDEMARAVINAYRETLRERGYKIVPEAATDRMRAEGESAASFGIGKPTDEKAIDLVWDWMVKAATEPEV